MKEYPHGTIVMSERQTKARGARDHKWDATNTGNIYVSIVLHMPPFGRVIQLCCCELRLRVLDSPVYQGKSQLSVQADFS